jgi:hypothetical protein
MRNLVAFIYYLSQMALEANEDVAGDAKAALAHLLDPYFRVSLAMRCDIYRCMTSPLLEIARGDKEGPAGTAEDYILPYFLW